MEKPPCFALKSYGLPVKLLAVFVALSAWDSLRCADSNLNPAAAARYSQKNGGTVLLISRKGMPDAAFYEPGYSPQTPSRVLSMTKSLTALACLSLREPSLEDVVRTTRGRFHITLRHLLSQTSGISPGFEKLYQKNLFDVRKAAASLPQEALPGERFDYGPSHYESIGNILGATDGSADGARQALTNFLSRLGICPVDWRTDGQGHIYLSAGVILTPEDLMKIGRFVLDRGRLPGAPPIIPKAKFEAALTGSRANPSYGLGFWLNNARADSQQRDIEDAIDGHLTPDDWKRMCLSYVAPRDLVCMVGSGGQRVYIIPSLGAVIVRLGHPSKFKDPAFLHALFSSRGR